MSYELLPGEQIGPGLRRVALYQLDHAQESLRQAGAEDEQPAHEAIHDARKRFKKIRALLRLVRGEIGPEIYERENAFYRDAGRRLSAVRDSYVLIVTLDDVLQTCAGELDARAFARTRAQLVEAQRELERRALDEGLLAAVAGDLEAGRAQLAALPIERQTFEALRPGLQRAYRRGRKRLRRAYANPTALHFHEWRKRVKDFWYHLRLLNPLWPGVFTAWAEELHVLSEMLGAGHDVAQLQARITAEPDLCVDEAQRRLLLASLARRWQEWAREAWPLGRRVYTENPGAFVDRVGGYWETWNHVSTREGL